MCGGYVVSWLPDYVPLISQAWLVLIMAYVVA